MLLNKHTSVTIMVDYETIYMLVQICNERKTSVSDLVTTILDEVVNQPDPNTL
jgi:hypothetical protein